MRNDLCHSYRGIDLSVGSILGLAGVLASGILESTGNAGAAILVALAVGIGCGAVNGFFVAVCEIPPFISTLGMMTLLRGCILVYTKGSPIPIKVDAYKFLAREQWPECRFLSSSLSSSSSLPTMC